MRRGSAPSHKSDVLAVKPSNSFDSLRASLGGGIPIRGAGHSTVGTKAQPPTGPSALLGLLNKPFKVPTGCVVSDRTLELRKTMRLGPPKSFQIVRPGDLSGLIKVSGMVMPCTSEEENEEEQLPSSNLPPFEPLVLWTDPNNPEKKIEVIPELACKLRPHQREGVQFLFECTMGMRGFDGQGCILADDMGLGKTLMSITLMWTLLNQGMGADNCTVRKVIIACPTSLVGNWDNEIRKWVGERCPTFAVKGEPKRTIKTFIGHRGKGVLIISYETQRLYSNMFNGSKFSGAHGCCCDMLICDEAHKLKNAESGLAKSLMLLPAKRRILLSGTPMQNELTEFYNMVNFCNPNVLGSLQDFRRRYERPILASREPDALDSEVVEATKLQKELSTIVNEFILKRGNILNAQHLPPKLVQFVCCRPTALQVTLIETLLNSKEIRHVREGKATNTLNVIRQLINICSHPRLVLDTYQRKLAAKEPIDDDLKALVAVIPQGTAQVPTSSTKGKGAAAPSNWVDPEQSGKMFTLFKMMQTMRILKPAEKIVIVSNYTQTLDLIELLCKQSHWSFLRLDGTISSSKRTKLVDEFNSPSSGCFAFLLSSKAGGCGINLIGANRLVLFDPDWNPASDKQAAGRIWREGQKRRCFIYRFMSTGSIEEKIIQRQLAKEGLADIVDDKEQVNCISTEELKALFTLRSAETASDTHDTLKCKRCVYVNNKDNAKKQRLGGNQLDACVAFLDSFDSYLLQESQAYQRRELKRTASATGAEMVEGTDNLCSLLPFSDAFNRLKAALHDGSFANLTAYSRKQREIFMGIEDSLATARRDKADKENVSNCSLADLFPPSVSIYSEFIKQWTDAVPMLMGMASVCAQEQMDVGEVTSEGLGFVEQVGCPDDTDINQWSHHSGVLSVDDDLLSSAFGDSEDSVISFVFGLEVNFSLLELKEAQNREEVEKRKADQMEALAELNARRKRVREGGCPDEQFSSLDGEEEAVQTKKGKGEKKRKKAKLEELIEDESLDEPVMAKLQASQELKSKKPRREYGNMGNLHQPVGRDPPKQIVDSSAIRSVDSDILFAADLAKLSKLAKKGKLAVDSFYPLWLVMKRENNNWRAFELDDGQEIYTRTPGLKAANYKSFAHYSDFFIGEIELLQWAHHQAVLAGPPAVEVNKVFEALLGQGAGDIHVEVEEENEFQQPQQAVLGMLDLIESDEEPKQPKKSRKKAIWSDDEDSDHEPARAPSAFDCLTASVSTAAFSPSGYAYFNSQDDVIRSPGVHVPAQAIVPATKPRPAANKVPLPVIKQVPTASACNSQSSEDGAEWECAKCTFKNEKKRKKCAMCEAKKE